VTLDATTATEQLSRDLLSALELSASEGAVILAGNGVLIDDPASQSVALRFDAKLDGGTYVNNGDGSQAFTREELFALATNGKFVGTLTARHGLNADVDHPQPAIWTRGPIERQRGRQQFPTLYDGNDRMKVSGRHIHKDSFVIIDGRRVNGNVSLQDSEKVEIELAALPPVGMHLLQLQNPNGLFSNDFIFHVAKNAEAAAELTRQTDRAHRDIREVLAEAIATGNLEHVKRILNRAGRRINERQPASGSTALSTAAFHDRIDIANLLIRRGAKVETTNRDGNTPLLVAAFMCRRKMVQLLLEKGASPLTKNGRGETSIDVVSSPWTKQLADIYTGIDNVVPEFKFNLERIERERPQMADLLRNHVEQAKTEKEE